MTDWVLKGLRAGIKSTHYPDGLDETPGISPGRPRAGRAGNAAELAALCPTEAIIASDGAVTLDHRTCIHCLRCRRNTEAPIEWEYGYEWAGVLPNIEDATRKLGQAFGRSLHVRFVDAGACGACMSEARQLTNPYYNLHRLGIFLTPSPRSADILLVAGPVTDAMRLPLRKTYDAMPAPKRVVAIGVCALSGGIFGPSFASGGGVAEIIPVDVAVPGCPPPPLAIVHGLLVAVERKPPVPLTSPELAG
jgi:Ni,Fe-hydrogenase III small subunit/ferredoxin-like protein FixX